MEQKTFDQWAIEKGLPYRQPMSKLITEQEFIDRVDYLKSLEN